MMLTNLLTNMVVLLNTAIPTNTKAFQEYAFQTMLKNAEVVAMKWHLDPASFTTNKVTEFLARPSLHGIEGIINFDSRYGFSFKGGRFSGFVDRVYDPSFMSSGDDKNRRAGLERWLASSNQFSRDQALQTADTALKAIGIPLDELQGGKPPMILPKNWTSGLDGA